MNKRKLPLEWTSANGSDQLSPKHIKTSYNHLLDDSDMDDLLSGIDFDDVMEVDSAADTQEAINAEVGQQRTRIFMSKHSS